MEQENKKDQVASEPVREAEAVQESQEAQETLRPQELQESKDVSPAQESQDAQDAQETPADQESQENPVVSESQEEQETPESASAAGEDRSAVQRKRAIGAVLVMVIFSLVLITCFEVMNYLSGEDISFFPSHDFTATVAEEVEEQVQIVTQETPTEPFYVLLIGSDSRKGTALYTGKADGHAQLDQHADIITLMRIDPENYLITLVSVPRDTQLEGTDSKINDSLLEGDPEEVVDAVEELTGEDIDYYMMTSFIGFEDLVNGVGGVNAKVGTTVSLTDPATASKVTLKESSKSQLLDGQQALVLARAREEYEVDQDAYRQENVRKLEENLIRRVLSNFDEDQVGLVMSVLEANVDTDMNYSITAALIRDFMEHADSVSFHSGTGPYEGDIDEQSGLWVIPEDKDTWDAVMAAVDEGGSPASIVETASAKAKREEEEAEAAAKAASETLEESSEDSSDQASALDSYE